MKKINLSVVLFSAMLVSTPALACKVTNDTYTLYDAKIKKIEERGETEELAEATRLRDEELQKQRLTIESAEYFCKILPAVLSPKEAAPFKRLTIMVSASPFYKTAGCFADEENNNAPVIVITSVTFAVLYDWISAFSYSTKFERETFDSFHLYHNYMLEYLKRVNNPRPGENDGGGLVNFILYKHLSESDERTQDLMTATQKTVNGARQFILLHEIAHAVKNHCAGGVSADIQRDREFAADEWALRHFISIGKANPTAMMMPLFLFWNASEALGIMGDLDHPTARERFRNALAVTVDEFKREGMWEEKSGGSQIDFFMDVFNREAEFSRLQANAIRSR